MTFYDSIAERYDEITGGSDRAAAAEAFVREFVPRYSVASAVDAACGTGVYAIALAAAGVDVVGVDVSEGMLRQARERAKTASLDIEWLCAPMQSLSDRLDRRFDAVVCMGNSLPHVLTDEEMAATLAGFVLLVGDGGVVVLQLLNYQRVLARQERIVGTDRCGDQWSVRFYDFLSDGLVRFNLLEIPTDDGGQGHQLHSTTLRPWTAAQLVDGLRAAGCGRVECYGGPGFAAFDASVAETVVLVGLKDD